MQIFVVDAFTSQPFKGNPAAVVIVEEFPSDEMCLKIAGEMNLSETAFVKKAAVKQFYIRWFTPLVEAKLCGHATLAAAHILFEQGITNTLHFDSLSGLLTVEKNEKGITLDFPLQETGDSIKLENILPVPMISAVKAHDCIIIELENEPTVRTLQVNPEELIKVDCRGIIVTAKGEGQYDFISRFFAPKVGIHEDPVTGSAHCKLAHYWMKKLQKTTFKAYQASKRGGELFLEIKEDRVHITGKAVTILAGKIHL
ncbi:MAG: PhzF family phenazine biosynthesis isomerase [Chlamydiia bacterium]|nr:PhzF family phenazine biosynthesis isomerase [Chlamydiia bacterium]